MQTLPVLSDDLEPVVRRVRQLVELSFARALQRAAAPGAAPAPAGNALEDVFAGFLRQRLGRAPSLRIAPRQRLDIAARAATARGLLATAAAKPQLFGPLARLDLAGPRSLSVQIRGNLFKDLIHKDSELVQGIARQRGAWATGDRLKPGGGREAFLGMLKGKFRFPPHLTERTQPPPSGGSGGQRSTQLQLNLIKFKCVDEMDWEVTDFGKDNISAGGKAWDTAGTNTDVSVFRVADFDGGDVFTFNPPRVFARYGLSGEQWPRFFFAQVALAEKDADGGFIEFLQKLWDAVDDTVIKEATDAILAALAAAGVGAAAGAIAGVEAAGVGAIVGAVVGAVIGFAVSLTLDSLKDDIFDVLDVPPAFLESPTSGFDGNGSRTSDTFSAEVSRDGAKYKVWYNWTLT